MNKVMLMGRLTRDPDVRWTQGPEQSAVARYTLAVDRRFKKEGGATADFIGCVAFGRQAEFAEKYLQLEPRSPSPAGFRPEAIQTETGRRSTRQMWLWRSKSSQRARAPARTGNQKERQNQRQMIVDL